MTNTTMKQTSIRELHPNRLIRRFLPWLASDWAEILIEAWKFVKRIFRREVHLGLYEILDYDAVLELRDAKGKTAVFKRRQKVRFLQNRITAYQYEAWGDGELFADLKCSPGVVADRYRHGLRHVVLISLRETKNRGDMAEFNIERTIKNGFTGSTEWFQTELNFRTHRVRVAVIFPRRRPCKRAILMQRSRNRTEVLGDANLSLLPDGRQMLAWEKAKPPVNELFTLKWTW
jgi:hypothetical protein